MKAEEHLAKAILKASNDYMPDSEEAKANALIAIALYLKEISDKIGNLRWR